MVYQLIVQDQRYRECSSPQRESQRERVSESWRLELAKDDRLTTWKFNTEPLPSLTATLSLNRELVTHHAKLSSELTKLLTTETKPHNALAGML